MQIPFFFFLVSALGGDANMTEVTLGPAAPLSGDDLKMIDTALADCPLLMPGRTPGCPVTAGGDGVLALTVTESCSTMSEDGVCIGTAMTRVVILPPESPLLAACQELNCDLAGIRCVFSADQLAMMPSGESGVSIRIAHYTGGGQEPDVTLYWFIPAGQSNLYRIF